MIEAFALPFMRNALLAGLVIGAVASFYGVFVVQRGLSFMGHGLAHAAFGGLALGILLNAEPLTTAIPFTIAVALGIVWIEQRTRIRADTAIGVFFAASMALGIVLLKAKQGYAGNVEAWLFGSILAIGARDLWAAAGLGLMALGTTCLWKSWAYATFDRELAEADRISVRRDDYILAVCLAVTVVVASKMLGIVLVAALLVIPAATARLYSRTFRGMTLLSILFGGLGVVLGLAASWPLNWPTGAAIILVEACAFFLSAIIRGRA